MISLNSTILSYNKVREIEEYQPLLPPESILNDQDILSFQEYIPEKYEIDKVEFNDLIFERKSAPYSERNKDYFSYILFNKGNNSRIHRKETYLKNDTPNFNYYKINNKKVNEKGKKLNKKIYLKNGMIKNDKYF